MAYKQKKCCFGWKKGTPWHIYKISTYVWLITHICSMICTIFIRLSWSKCNVNVSAAIWSFRTVSSMSGLIMLVTASASSRTWLARADNTTPKNKPERNSTDKHTICSLVVHQGTVIVTSSRCIALIRPFLDTIGPTYPFKTRNSYIGTQKTMWAFNWTVQQIQVEKHTGKQLFDHNVFTNLFQVALQLVWTAGGHTWALLR